MNPVSDPPPPANADREPPAIAAAVERRARGLLVLLGVLLLASTLYVLYARGVFEPTQTLVLTADDAEGVAVGMDLTFSGFPIGRVRRIELAPDGTVRIVIDVVRREAHWLREGSVFTMERGLVGGVRLRAYTGVLEGPLLPDGAKRPVLRGDALADLPRMVNTARELLEQIKAMTAADAPLNASLRELQQLLARANGREGVLGVLVGNDADRQRVTAAVDDVRRLLQHLQGVAERADRLVQQADQRVFGAQGLADDVQGGVRQARELLLDLRATLQRVDAVLVEAQGVAANARTATQDLDALRAEVETTLRRVDGMILDIQRRWPFGTNPELRLP